MNPKTRYIVLLVVIVIFAVLVSLRCDAGTIEILNRQRAQRELYPLKADPVLMEIAQERLEANVRRGNWQHNIRNGQFVGRFRPARAEGCGNTYSPNRWYTCDWDTSRYRRAGVAMTKVGNRYWQLLLLR